MSALGQTLTDSFGGLWEVVSTGGGCEALASRVVYRNPVLGLRLGSVLISEDATEPVLGEARGVAFGLFDKSTGEWVNGEHGVDERWGELAGVGEWVTSSPILTGDEIVTALGSFFARWGVVPVAVI